MAGLRVHFVFPAVLVERVDAALAEGESRGEFVRRAVEQALGAPSVDRMVGRLEGEGLLVPAVEQALSEAKEPLTKEQADSGSVSSSEGVRSAAPAEQPLTAQLAREIERNNEQLRSYRQHVPGPNVEGVRSSAQVKGDIRPVPKRGEKK